METQRKRLSLNGNTLKLIAIITMLIDHLTYVFIEAGILPKINASYIGGQSLDYTSEDYMFWSMMDVIGRGIGRLAFPIFVFLLVEGFLHTRNVWKYALRLGLFAIISEIPFDMAFNKEFFNWQYQSVYVTLLIGLLMMVGFEAVANRFSGKISIVLTQTLIFIVALAASHFAFCDYAEMGIAMIAAVYFTRNRRNFTWLAVLIAMIITIPVVNSSPIEVIGCLSFLLIALYNGERGNFSLKYLFYAFYPAHLLILGLINIFIIK